MADGVMLFPDDTGDMPSLDARFSWMAPHRDCTAHTETQTLDGSLPATLEWVMQ